MGKAEGRVVRSLITSLSVMLMLFGALYISNALEFMGIHISIVPYCALILMLVLVLVFIIYPLRSGAGKKGSRGTTLSSCS